MSAMDLDEVRARVDALRGRDLPTHGGRTLAYVYDSGLPDVDRIGREAVATAAASNGLDPTAFPSLLRMENDLVAFGLRLLDAPDGAVGTVSSGGTESVLRHLDPATESLRREPPPETVDRIRIVADRPVLVLIEDHVVKPEVGDALPGPDDIILAVEMLHTTMDRRSVLPIGLADDRDHELAHHVAAHHQHIRAVERRGVQELPPRSLRTVHVRGVEDLRPPLPRRPPEDSHGRQTP